MTRFIPLSIILEGLKKHVTKLGYDYAELDKYFKTKATNAYISRALKNGEGNSPNRNTVAKWRKVWVDEQAMEKLRDV